MKQNGNFNRIAVDIYASFVLNNEASWIYLGTFRHMFFANGVRRCVAQATVQTACKVDASVVAAVRGNLFIVLID